MRVQITNDEFPESTIFHERRGLTGEVVHLHCHAWAPYYLVTIKLDNPPVGDRFKGMWKTRSCDLTPLAGEPTFHEFRSQMIAAENAALDNSVNVG